MTKEELQAYGGTVFFGDCHAVQILERIAGKHYPDKKPNDRINPLIVIWTEDDGNWSEGNSFDAAWLPEFIRLLISAEDVATVEWPRKGRLNEVAPR